MPIPLPLLDRIRSSALSGPQVADAFVELAHAADATESAECAIRIEYLGNGEMPQPGDLVPTIILALERQRP